MSTIPDLINITVASSDSLLIVHNMETGITSNITVADLACSPRRIKLNFLTNTSWTPTYPDNLEQVIQISNTSPITVTIPRSEFQVGDQMHFRQGSTGQISFVGATGVTIEIPADTVASTRAVGELVTIYCRFTSVDEEIWCLFGGLEQV